MSWREEFRRSLKAVETEEPIDLYLYRPLAFGLAKLLIRTRLSANEVSVLSLLFGGLAGALFWQQLYLWGAASYFLCNVFDCADGQVARMRGTSSMLGYIVDGSIDYLATLAVFLGMSHALTLAHPGEAAGWWALGAAWLAAYGWQCAILDRKRHEWMSQVHGRRSDPAQELADLERARDEWRRTGTHLGGRALVALYSFNKRTWAHFIAPPSLADVPPERWAERHRAALRTAVWMGPSLQMTAIMIAALFGRFDLFFLGSLVLGSLCALSVLALERRSLQPTLKAE